MLKMDSLIHFLSKNVYNDNDVLCINGSKVKNFNAFTK